MRLAGPFEMAIVSATSVTAQCGRCLVVTIRKTDRATLVLIHGAWHGPWVWARVEPHLMSAGWRVITIKLPSVADGSEPHIGMMADADVIRRRLVDIDEPVVVVAHSYAGVPVSQGAAGLLNVRHIIYLAAFQLDIGDSLLSVLRGETPSWWQVNPPITTVRNPHDLFYNDMTPEDAAWAAAQLKPHNYAVATERLTEAAWRTIPSTYVVCEQDQCLPPAVQEAMATRATQVRRLPTSHSPFLSQPFATARLIGEIAE
jgi:pimeloyl-ACP methyl ester carboxylesterase